MYHAGVFEIDFLWMISPFCFPTCLAIVVNDMLNIKPHWRSPMIKKKTTVAVCTILGLALSTTCVWAYKFDFVTVSDIVKKIKDRFSGIKTYEANFRITTEKTGNKSVQTGILRYKAPDKMIVIFQQPYGQKIIANGKTMWIYIPSMNVVAEQDLKDEGGFFSSASVNGLQRLFSKYHYRFLSKNQPEPQQNGPRMYTLQLKQKETRSGYRTINLWVTEDYLIMRALGETSTGKKIEIVFSDIKTDIDIPNGMFKFDMPAQARVIKNPMMAEE